jgi:hypothetical protein
MARFFSSTPRHLTEVDFCAWVGRAAPADTLEYYRGLLSVDTELDPFSAPERKALRRLARRAVWASDVGLVHLVQRRNGPGDFSYLAVRRPRQRAPRQGRKVAALARATTDVLQAA